MYRGKHKIIMHFALLLSEFGNGSDLSHDAPMVDDVYQFFETFSVRFSINAKKHVVSMTWVEVGRATQGLKYRWKVSLLPLR